MSRWHTEGDLPSISSALTKAFSFSLLLAVPVVTGGIILGDKLLYYLYGADFEAGASALILLLLVQIATIFVTLQISCLNALDKPRSSFIATTLSASVNIILNITLIPLLGILGSACATLISVVMNALISYQLLSSHLQVTLDWESLRNILIAAGIMAVLVLAFRFAIGISSVLYLLTAVTAGAVVYLLILFRLDDNLRMETMNLLRSIGFF
jgi:O-antigen/teichoic acid export membrane protein